MTLPDVNEPQFVTDKGATPTSSKHIKTNNFFIIYSFLMSNGGRKGQAMHS